MAKPKIYDIYGKKSAKRILKDLIVWPPKENERRTEDGYPQELIYDDFAYFRMVDFYREHMKAVLKRM